ncbi:transporter substrate-binding domain-containing protein [Sphingomonas sp. MG17]|uniref:Transporter substrate-binding domain-containing protein n=1 Tax=Sphingomonas tagetis TaxID=2949092 RepID=A0A9X2KM19_9SPHN|nr:transporter substrate-binding domain-containing protein [Sphingomonas tagetis]
MNCRFAVNLSNAALVAMDDHGRMTGMAPEVADRVASAIGKRAILLPFATAADILNAGEGTWDVAFLAIDPARRETVAFTQPYLTLAVGGLARSQSQLDRIDQVDRPGMRIGCAKGAYLTSVRQSLRHAAFVEFGSAGETLEALLRGEIDVAVGLTAALHKVASGSDLRVLDGTFAHVEHALAVRRDHIESIAALEHALRTNSGALPRCATAGTG